MVPLWVWFSRLIITEEMDKEPCIEFCANRESKMITVGHLEYASSFQVFKHLLQGDCKNPENRGETFSGFFQCFPEFQTQNIFLRIFSSFVVWPFSGFFFQRFPFFFPVWIFQPLD